MPVEPSSATETQALLSDRVSTSAHYFENALAVLDEHDYRKAAELLWGSVAQMVKALALVTGEDIRSHGRLHQFMVESFAIKDPSLLTSFREIEMLHTHFYDVALEPSEVEELSGKARELLERLRSELYAHLGPPASEAEIAGRTIFEDES